MTQDPEAQSSLNTHAIPGVRVVELATAATVVVEGGGAAGAEVTVKKRDEEAEVARTLLTHQLLLEFLKKQIVNVPRSRSRGGP